MAPTDLPVLELRAGLVDALRSGSRVVLEAPTGSGKSTQVPQWIRDSGICGECEVVVLQPRRIAARMLAERVAWERKVQTGGEVGYQVRFEGKVSGATRIRFVTEGILLRQMLSSPGLPGVGAIVFDEFHERHLYGDVTLAQAMRLQGNRRPDLKLVVMSATLDSARLEEYLEPCTVLRSKGRTFPVSVQYEAKGLSDPLQPWDEAVRALESLSRGHEGDALIFMPGAYEIDRTMRAIRESSVLRDWVVFPLHGELPPARQDEAVAPSERRKAIVSTNVAETSLTIEGVRIVIDSGLARMGRFDPHRGINTLLIEKISRASADQRAGRAGRTAPGVCARLWTEREQEHRAARELPEVRRLDLAEIFLTLKASGIDAATDFPWLDAPDPVAAARAARSLVELGAVDAESGEITTTGRRMLAFPLHPRHSRMLIEADARGCVRPVALIAALTQGRNLLLRSTDRQVLGKREDLFGTDDKSDLAVWMRAWMYAERLNYDPARCRELGIHMVTARQTSRLYEQFLGIARAQGLDLATESTDESQVRRCVLAGFSDFLGRRLDGGTLRCALTGGRKGAIGRESVVRDSDFVVATEISEIQQRGDELNVLLQGVVAVELEWVRELFADDFHTEECVSYDPGSKRVVARRRTQFRDLILEEAISGNPRPEAAARVLSEEVAKGNLKIHGWDDSTEEWIARVNGLSVWMPDLGISPIGELDREMLVGQFCQGAMGYKDIKDKPGLPVVKTWLSREQHRMLDEYAPERVKLPGGKTAKVIYAIGAEPAIAVRIQELYGLEGEIRIANRRVALVIQVLAPNHRPVQITRDLSTFWKEGYPAIKNQLQRRYPKHHWI